MMSLQYSDNILRYQERKQKSRSKKLDSGSLREISKLLAKEGAVTGKGEIIEKQAADKDKVDKAMVVSGNRRKKKVMVDTVTQVDSVTIELEIKKAEKQTDRCVLVTMFVETWIIFVELVLLRSPDSWQLS